MNKRKLGRTNLYVSELCLSTGKSSWINDEATSFALLDAYRAEGGNFIQSVALSQSSLAPQPVNSQSEEVVGRWHQSRAIPRDSLVLATRVDLIRPAHGGSVSFANLIRESCENSLRRLQTKHIDLLVCEWDEQITPIEDVIDVFDRIIRAGLVRNIVAGGFPPWRVVDSLHRSSVRNRCRFEALQTEYSLITRARFEAEALAMCQEHRLGFIARSPLAGGFLAKRPISIRESVNMDRNWLSERFGNRYGDAVLTTLTKIAEKFGASPAQIAVAWVLQNSQVCSTVVSPTSVNDLQELIQSAGIKLGGDEIGALVDVTRDENCLKELRHA
jgi:aryl-alcohol dehydrogenase-like predicted oxidoreductase